MGVTGMEITRQPVAGTASNSAGVGGGAAHGAADDMIILKRGGVSPADAGRISPLEGSNGRHRMCPSATHVRRWLIGCDLHFLLEAKGIIDTNRVKTGIKIARLAKRPRMKYPYFTAVYGRR